MRTARRNEKGLTAADIAKLRQKNSSAIRIEELLQSQHLSPAARKKLEAQLGTFTEGPKGKLFEVSWYSPGMRRRVKAGALIESQTKSGAIAEVKASFAGADKTRPKELRPANFIATEVKKNGNEIIPLFCADCDRVLKGRGVRMRDSRVVCPTCAKKAQVKGQKKKQPRLFEDEQILFQNGKLRNVEGYLDDVGQFHPIRSSDGYNEFLTTDVASPAEKKERAHKHLYKRTVQYYAGPAGKRHVSKVAKHHRTLSQYVRGAGGIKAPKNHDLRGELRGLGRRESGTTGLLNQRDGTIPEYMMDAANTEGYRDRHGHKFTNVGDFLLAVGDDVSAKKKYYTREALNEIENPAAMTEHKKKIICEKCGGSHHESYCQARGNGSRVRKVAKPGVKKNIFGLDRKSRKRRAKKRSAKRTLRADQLEAKARYLRSVNPKPKLRQLEARRSELAQDLINLTVALQAPGVDQKRVRAERHRKQVEFNRLGKVMLGQWEASGRKGNPDFLDVFSKGSAGLLNALQIHSHLTRAATAAPKRRNRRRTAQQRMGNGKAVSKKNSLTPANEKIYREFHGLPLSGEIFKGFAPAGAPKDLAMLGDLRLIKLENGRVQKYKVGEAQLGAAQHGPMRRMYTVLETPHPLTPYLQNGIGHEHDYGPITQVEYDAQKPHLYKTMRMFLFFHKLGEEGGKRPHLIAHPNPKGVTLEIRGGDYQIKREGIRD